MWVLSWGNYNDTTLVIDSRDVLVVRYVLDVLVVLFGGVMMFASNSSQVFDLTLLTKTIPAVILASWNLEQMFNTGSRY